MVANFHLPLVANLGDQKILVIKLGDQNLATEFFEQCPNFFNHLPKILTI
jgi:hypothetical protein